MSGTTETASGVTSHSSDFQGSSSPTNTTSSSTTTTTTTTSSSSSTTLKSKSTATSVHQNRSLVGSRRSTRSNKKQSTTKSSSSPSMTKSMTKSSPFTASSQQKKSKLQQQQQQQLNETDSEESPTRDGFPYTSSVPNMAQTLFTEFNKLSEARGSDQSERKQLLRERPDWSKQRNEAYVTAFNLNVDIHREAELGSRLALILAKAINMLTDEQQRQHFTQLVQDAKNVGYSDISHRIENIQKGDGTRYFHADIENVDDQAVP